jgi:hypothetical protein
VRSVPRLCEFYPGICLRTEVKARKNLSHGKKNLSQVKKNLSHSTVYILPKTPTHYNALTKHTHYKTHSYTHYCRLSWNLEASAFWKPRGLSRPVMGLLYLYCFTYVFILDFYLVSCLCLCTVNLDLCHTPVWLLVSTLDEQGKFQTYMIFVSATLPLSAL